MNTKSFGILTATTIMLTGGVANANLLFDIYAGGTYGLGGYTLFADDDHISKSAQTYGAILGMDIPLFRIELEYNFLDSDKFETNLGMVNGYFKIPTPVLKPYIGAGIGTTFSGKYKPTSLPHINIDNAMAYQGMLGITLDLPVIPFNIDIEGRVLYAPNAFKITRNDTDILQYDGRIKLRYVF